VSVSVIVAVSAAVAVIVSIIVAVLVAVAAVMVTGIGYCCQALTCWKDDRVPVPV
jgi:hypothetical protein